MLISKLLKFLLLSLSFRIVEEGGGGGVSDGSPAPASDASTVVVDPAGTPAAPVASPAPAPTMFDAISAHFDGRTASLTDPATGQPRDPLGRFAPKDATGAPIPPAAAVPVVPGAPAVAAVVPPVVAKPAVVPGAVDLTMPEGLQPKSQERFRQMAETVKTTTAERDEARGQVSYLRDTFQKHGITQDQFEQASSVIGMLNAKNYQGALQVLDEQRRQIALLTGQPLPGVDALSDHPDLRAAVDDLRIGETAAIELARSRTQQAQQQRAQQEQQQTQQAEAQEKQQVQTALGEVDGLVKHLQSTDIDFAAIEAQLIPALKDLLAHVPPNQWKNAVQAQYSLLKRSASAFRVASPGGGGGVLRPTGQAAPGTVPRTMQEAMFGPRA